MSQVKGQAVPQVSNSLPLVQVGCGGAVAAVTVDVALAVVVPKHDKIAHYKDTIIMTDRKLELSRAHTPRAASVFI